MTFKKTYVATLSVVMAAIFLLACGQTTSTKKSTKIETTSESHPFSDTIKYLDRQSLTIDTFSAFPPEIEGCSCYFSNDSIEFKKNVYIYMNDYAKTSFLKVNGVLTKFIQTDFKEINKTKTIVEAKSDKYEITVEVIDGFQNGDETWLKTGTIKLTDQKGNTAIKRFYGACGC